MLTPSILLLDPPYVSPFLLDTIAEHNLPVVKTQAAQAFGIEDYPSALTESEAVEVALASSAPLVHAVSEESIGWIARHLAATELPTQIARFKDKARFRRDTAALFPGLFHHESTLQDLDLAELPLPFVIKPSVGFFSLGVKRIETERELPGLKKELEAELAGAEGLFPQEVLDATHFLVESYIDGQEFAVDAYYDEHGDPVILSILEHWFRSESDMSDRVYVTSKKIVTANIERFTQLLADIGSVFGVRNFAVHLELRVDALGRMWPIEVNPLRFGGWCTTADLTHLAFGLNPYACLFKQERPDWEEALRGKDDQLFSIVALGNSTGVDGRDIQSFDYEGLLARFAHPLELRRTNFRDYPIFGFLFTETSAGDSAELQQILHSDLREFIVPR